MFSSRSLEARFYRELDQLMVKEKFENTLVHTLISTVLNIDDSPRENFCSLLKNVSRNRGFYIEGGGGLSSPAEMITDNMEYGEKEFDGRVSIEINRDATEVQTDLIWLDDLVSVIKLTARLYDISVTPIPNLKEQLSQLDNLQEEYTSYLQNKPTNYQYKLVF